jgi:type III secretion protein V
MSDPADSMTIVGHPAFLDLLRPDYVFEQIVQSRVDFGLETSFAAPASGYRFDESVPPGRVVVEIDRVPVGEFEIAGVAPPTPLTLEQAKDYGRKLLKIRLANAHRMFSVPEATEWLQNAQASSGRLAADIQQLMPLMTLIEVMRRMLEDGMSLSPPRLVLEGLVQASQRSQDPDTIVEVLRGFMRRQISHFNANGRVIDALVIAPDVDNTLRQMNGFDQGPGDIKAGDDIVLRFIANARNLVKAHEQDDRRLVVMTTADTRRTARKVLKQYGIEVPVLSYSDVAPDYEVRTLAVLSAEQTAAQAA